MAGNEPMPQSIQPEQHVLVYDRIAKNRRQTWIMMLLFVVLLGGFVTLVAYLLGSVQTGTYANVGFSITWLLNSVVAGITSIAGPMIGAFFFGLLPELSRGEVKAAAISFWPQVTAGVLLILIMAFNPEGIASMGRFLRTRVSAHEEKDEDLEAIESATFGEPEKPKRRSKPKVLAR